jgi:sporulation protein YlmC with PRC-barrel domain
MKKLALLVASLLCLTIAPAFAAGETDLGMLETLSELNRIQPLQNPAYTRLAKIEERNLLDRKNRVVGQVKDVIIGDRGQISSLNVEFDRLRMRDTVFLNYADMNIRPSSNGYILTYDKDQIEDLYPSFLSSMESAAGTDSDVFSAKKLPGAMVETADGRRLGIVEDVLFANEGARVEALFVNIKMGVLRGKTIAIPYSMGKFQQTGTGRFVKVSNADADTVLAFAAQEKKNKK